MKKCFLTVLSVLCIYFLPCAQCPSTYLILHNQAEVNAFPSNYPGCAYLNVRLDIGVFNGASDITDLTPLNQLTGCSNKIYIWYNPNLTSLSGLENLTEVLQDFTIQANHALTNLSGLEGLQNAGALLKIENNNNLQTLEGLTAGGVLTELESLVIIENDNLTDLSNVLDNLQTVNEYVYIQDNASLTTLNTMNNLTSIGQYLTVDNHPSLTSLNAFGSLETVGLLSPGWDFEVIDCPQLQTLNEFVNLSLVGKNFEISGNTSLTDMSFPNLSDVDGAMSIVGTSLTSLFGLGDFMLTGPLSILSNPSLPECEADGVCLYLDGPGQASINNNATGCSTVAQVEAACAALPVELVFFKGNETNGEVYLNWQTASEKENDHFLVEHSEDGSAFEPVGKVYGSGTTALASNYSFLHSQPVKGANYYRLKQVDHDGTYSYSDIVRVETASGRAIEIYPNPTTGYARLKGDLAEGTMRLSDITGRLIYEKKLPDQYSIDLTWQPEGVYIVEIQMDNEKITKRVVKERIRY
ncbi:MAG: T9SS C-terminal target domain-containing protein [Haliscomenobacteraceae bacterium CHB4]|nr:T9SS C-terminal target domain-containing protein [Haliscomenobacteraceae bacterium CHB4]